jgi:hypothetical protein
MSGGGEWKGWGWRGSGEERKVEGRGDHKPPRAGWYTDSIQFSNH